MQEQHLFEYAVIRVVPRVEREEFLNVGIVLYCAKKKYLKAMFELDEQRMAAFGKQIDIAELKEYLCAIERISTGGADGGPIGALPPGERFRWLTATRSTVVQTSKVHPGLCTDEDEMIAKLYREMVQNEEAEPQISK